jgi:hypothetical protein
MPTKHAFNPDRPLPFFLAAERMQVSEKLGTELLSRGGSSRRVFWLQPRLRSVSRFYRWETA